MTPRLRRARLALDPAREGTIDLEAWGQSPDGGTLHAALGNHPLEGAEPVLRLAPHDGYFR